MKNTIIAPSLLAARSSDLGREVAMVEKAGAKYLHIDVMDGHFVPNLTFGPHIVEGIRDKSSLYFDVHLMVEYPERHVLPFIKAGANCITIHGEAPGDIDSVIKICRDNNVGFGLSLKPKTPLEEFASYYTQCEILLIMSAEPGFGGQDFMPCSPQRIAQAKSLREKINAGYKISVDGGINPETASLCVAAGVDILVAGHAIFDSEDPTDVIRQLLKA